MESHEVAEQIKVEHYLLQQLMEGVRRTTGWQVEGPDASRKVSTLRFLVESFQRHLDRLLTLEEHGGYMDLVVVSDPRLSRTTATMQAEHDRFRTDARQIAGRLEALPATDLVELGGICEALLGLVRQIEKHNHKEIALLQEAFGQESGGEG